MNKNGGEGWCRKAGEKVLLRGEEEKQWVMGPVTKLRSPGKEKV